eukprot:3388384-Rhodomonas_salina.2
MMRCHLQGSVCPRNRCQAPIGPSQCRGSTRDSQRGLPPSLVSPSKSRSFRVCEARASLFKL